MHLVIICSHFVLFLVDEWRRSVAQPAQLSDIIKHHQLEHLSAFSTIFFSRLVAFLCRTDGDAAAEGGTKHQERILNSPLKEAIYRHCQKERLKYTKHVWFWEW